MRILHGQVQCAGALPARLIDAPGPDPGRRYQFIVDVRAGLQQQLHHRLAAFAHRHQQWRETGVEPDSEIRARVDQLLGRLYVAFGGGPQDGGLAARFLRFHVRALRQQPVNSRRFTRPRRGHQRRFASRERGVRIRAGLEQQFHHRSVAVGASQRQHRHTIAIRRVRVSSGLEQKPRHLQVVLADRPMQRRGAVNLRSICVGVPVE